MEHAAWAALVEMLVGNPAQIRQMLAEHGERDGRCKACVGAGGTRPRFPCTLHQAAQRASDALRNR